MLASIFISDLLMWNSGKFSENNASGNDESSNSTSSEALYIEQRRIAAPEICDDIFRDNNSVSGKNDCF